MSKEEKERDSWKRENEKFIEIDLKFIGTFGIIILSDHETREVEKMKAVITVVGHDTKGIIAKVSAKCAAAGANIVEISPSVLKEYFAMIMVIDITGLEKPFTEFVDEMRLLGEANSLDIRAMHEDIFNSMHKI